MWKKRATLLAGLLLAGPIAAVAVGGVSLGQDWRTADRSSTGIAPDPATTPEALVQVYAARAFNWRGVLGVHTWIATKAQGADHFVVHQVMGWRAYHGQPVVVSHRDVPDRSWFGNAPWLVAQLRGEAASAAMPQVEAAIRDYPYADRYVLWPGPNSNISPAAKSRRGRDG